MAHPTDSEILALLKSDATRERGFTYLVNKYKENIYWVVRRIVFDHDDANDIVQNTFIKIWKYIPFFKEDSRIFTWMYRIAINEALSFLKNKKAHLKISLEEMIEQTGDSFKADSYFSGSKIQQKLWHEIQKLPEKQKIVFILKYFNNLSYDQISQILKTNISTLKVTYHIVVKKILENLAKND
ncbi:MAG: RNA polymerase sigma factor [Bacteroidales bacterium]|nr:RNA polymerase sigma factor [Bacteroidales bacterium]